MCSCKYSPTTRRWELERKGTLNTIFRDGKQVKRSFKGMDPTEAPKCPNHMLYPLPSFQYHNWKISNSSLLTTVFLIWIIPTVIHSITLPGSKNTLPIVANHLITMTFLVAIHWFIRPISTIIISITKVFLFQKSKIIWFSIHHIHIPTSIYATHTHTCTHIWINTHVQYTVFQENMVWSHSAWRSLQCF